MGGGGGAQLNFSWWDGMPTPGSAIITYSMGSGITVQHYHTTWNTVIAALNAWCAANLSGAASYSFTLTDPTNDGPRELTQYQNACFLNGNGQSESFYFKGVDINNLAKATSLY